MTITITQIGHNINTIADAEKFSFPTEKGLTSVNPPYNALHKNTSCQISSKCKAYKVQYGLGFQKYFLFTSYIFTKKQAKYVLQKNKYSLVLNNRYDNPKQ